MTAPTIHPSIAASFEGLYDRLMAMQLSCIHEGAEACYISPESFLEYPGCESPIEALLGWAIMCSAHNTGGISVYLAHEPVDGVKDATELLDRFCANCSCTMLWGPAQKVVLIPQSRLGRYRVDFLLAHRDMYGHPDHDGDRYLLIVECDGHDFHERTPQQAARDKKRDRALSLMGIPVLRFTGSEINHDPVGCGNQVWEMIGRFAGERGRLLYPRAGS